MNATVIKSTIAGPTAVATTVVNSVCGAADGSVTIGAVTGGTAPYTYSFNGSAYTSITSYTGLIAGSYSLIVKDDTGATYTTTVTVIDNPGPTAVATTIVNETCGGANGSITIGAVTDGTGPYTNSFNSGGFTATNVYTGLQAGSYPIIIKDANGCTYNTAVTVIDNSGPTAITTNIVNEVCGASNGSVTLGVVTGGTAPYTYAFNYPPGAGPYTSVTNYTGLAAGTYTLDVKDTNGCIYTTSVTIINSGAPTSITTTIVDETCGATNGSITLGAVTGGTAPYTYSFIGSAYTTNTIFSGLTAGTYDIDVKDANGCIYSTTVIINNSGGITAIATTIVDEVC